MNDKIYCSHTADVPSSTSSEVTVLNKRFKRNRWFDDDDSCNFSRQSNLRERQNYLGTIEVREPYENSEKPDTKTGSDCHLAVGGGVVRERYGPSERAGTFEIATDSAAAVCRPEAKSFVEFAVWRTTTDRNRRGRRVLWFTARKEMRPAAATNIRALEVWKDRNNGYPSKVVFLQK